MDYSDMKGKMSNIQLHNQITLIILILAIQEISKWILDLFENTMFAHQLYRFVNCWLRLCCMYAWHVRFKWIDTQLTYDQFK